MSNEGEELYDYYVACPYPQGHISYKSNVFFQHDRIEEVYFKGFETAGEKLLCGRLNQAFEEN